MQFYFDPSRESDAHSLPDGEVFHSSEFNAGPCADEDTRLDDGYYYWACFPGCLPDGDPIGPFVSEAEAITDAQADFMPEDGNSYELNRNLPI